VPGRVVAISSSDSPLKGVRVLLEAVAKLRTERDVELVVVGRPKADGPVARAVEDLGLAGAVRFVTDIPESALADLMASAEMAVVPSLYEGFSIPAVEAMACGTPLVASRAGALPEVVGSDGSCAVLCEPGDPSSLAGAMATLFDDPARRAALGVAGRARVEQRFTWRAVAAATAEVYAETLARSRAC
jgi:glycosyltransferase involved in cell wall biosynthesis